MTPITFPDNIDPDRYDHLIVHAAATTAAMTEVDTNWIDRSHRARGWSGCGYNAVILRSGELQHETTGHRTRPYRKVGAHVGGCGPGWNQRSIGITMAGGVKADGHTPENNFTEAQLETLHAYIEAAIAHFGIPVGNVMGHRDLIKQTNAAPKACPCFDVREWLNGEPLETYFNPAPGQRPASKLRVPKVYTVHDGDTLWGIGNTYGIPVAVIRHLNNGHGDTIHPGEKLRLIE